MSSEVSATVTKTKDKGTDVGALVGTTITTIITFILMVITAYAWHYAFVQTVEHKPHKRAYVYATAMLLAAVAIGVVFAIVSRLLHVPAQEDIKIVGTYGEPQSNPRKALLQELLREETAADDAQRRKAYNPVMSVADTNLPLHFTD